jgi:hypothetical protein
MKIDLNKELKSLKDLDTLKEIFSKVYSKALRIDIDKAREIVSAKFIKHTDILSHKLEKGITEENVKNIKSAKDVDLNEYLKDKPIIKG